MFQVSAPDLTGAERDAIRAGREVRAAATDARPSGDGVYRERLA